MKASETKLQSIIEGTNQYVVPLFQRTYSWGEKEWRVLWEDLLDLCRQEEPSNHFIGSLVTMQTQSVPEGVTKFLLIDGQQRMTTLFILLALLRDRADAVGDSLAQEIQETLLTNRFKKGNDFFKLLPTQGDRASFTSIISGKSAGQPDGQIARAYKALDRLLSKAPDLSIEKLKQVIVTKIVLVSIVLDKDDDPYLIFESLNAKGMELTQADLIRNYFFMRIHVDQQESLFEQFWKPMQNSLGESLTEFIRHFLMKEGVIVKQNEVYFALKERADQKSQTEVLVYMEELARFATYYSKILRPEEETNSEIGVPMRRLNRIEVTTAYPLLLNVYHDYAIGTVKAEDFIAVLNLLENFMIRRWVCSVPTYGLNKVFPVLYSQAKRAGSLVEGLKDALHTKNYPRNADFRERFITAKLYLPGERAAKTKLILERLEAAFGHLERVPFDDLTVEHVMPQTLTPPWQAHLGEDWEGTHQILLHTIGNLTLTAYNPALSNAPFEEKKSILLNSHLDLNKDFLSVACWNEESIRNRANVLADSALTIWPYFGPEVKEGNSDLDVAHSTPRKKSESGGKGFDVFKELIGNKAISRESVVKKLVDAKIGLPSARAYICWAKRPLKNGTDPAKRGNPHGFQIREFKDKDGTKMLERIK